MNKQQRFDFQYTETFEGIESEHTLTLYAFDLPCACEKWVRYKHTIPSATQTLNSIKARNWPMTEQQFRSVARLAYGQGHYVIFDEDAQVNTLDTGAYVQAWVWVDDPEQD